MRILLANDDGIHGLGLHTLAQVLSKRYEVTVVAPDNERSAAGHSMTIRDILRVRPVQLPNADCSAFALSGTPVDCVKFGLDVLMQEKPDLVVSGINDGSNLGTDALYSGTVAAALEGALLGFPAIAISQCRTNQCSYTAAAQFLYEFLDTFTQFTLPFGTALNINVPEGEIKGVKYTRQGIRRYTDQYIVREDPFGKKYYWLYGKPIKPELEDADTDVAYNQQQYITIVPLNYYFTDDRTLEEMKMRVK